MGGKRFKPPKEEENILRLPSPITLEILSRLPVKTIIHCSSVCKAWRSLLLDPCFPQLHLAKSPVNLMLYNYGAFPSYRLIEFDQDLGKRKLSKFKDECVLASKQTCVVGSCNGLICLKAFIKKKEHYYVWNPVKNDSVILPMPNLEIKGKQFVSTASGFGFCPRTKVYKVIRTFRYYGMSSRNEAMCEVCTLGTNANWRTIQNVPAPRIYHYNRSRNMHAFLNGAVHWFNHDNSRMGVCAFRIEDEKWVQIRLSLPLLPVNTLFCLSVLLGVLENCLAIFHKSVDDFTFNVWMMKEYGVRESWTKCWSIQIERTAEMKYVPSLLPLKLTTDGDLIIYDQNSQALVCFNPQMGLITRKQRITYGLGNGHRRMCYVLPYVASFISPTTQVMKLEE